MSIWIESYVYFFLIMLLIAFSNILCIYIYGQVYHFMLVFKKKGVHGCIFENNTNNNVFRTVLFSFCVVATHRYFLQNSDRQKIQKNMFYTQKNAKKCVTFGPHEIK